MSLASQTERGFDLALGAGFQDRELHPLHARCVLHVSRDPLHLQIARAYQQSDHAGLRHQLGQQLQSLEGQLGEHEADARARAARPGETGDEAGRNRVGADDEDNRDRRGCALRRERRLVAGRDDQINLAADEVGGQFGQPIIVTLRPTIFDRQVWPST